MAIMLELSLCFVAYFHRNPNLYEYDKIINNLITPNFNEVKSISKHKSHIRKLEYFFLKLTSSRNIWEIFTNEFFPRIAPFDDKTFKRVSNFSDGTSYMVSFPIIRQKREKQCKL